MRRLAILLLVLLAAAEIAYRFPLRPGRPIGATPENSVNYDSIKFSKPFLWDFANAYASARAWLHGENPFDAQIIAQEWASAGTQPWRMLKAHWAGVHPPTTLVMLAPFAALPALPAMICWFLFCLALIVLEICALVSIARLSWRDQNTWLMVAAMLAATPIKVALLSGQLAVPSVACVVLGIWCIFRGGDLQGGTLLGLASAFKLQIGGPFLLYYVLLRNWRAAIPGLLILAIVVAVAIIPLQLHDHSWLNSWLAQMQQTVQSGGVNDPTPGGRYRFEILNLHVLLHGFIHDAQRVRIIGGCLVALLFACYLIALLRNKPRRDELLPLATLAALCLIPIYHKVYDASILVLALAWALAALHTRADVPARLSLLFLSVFLIPADIIHSIRIRFPAFNSVAEQPWFNALLVPHYAWGMFALTVLLTTTMLLQKEPRPSTIAD